MEERGPVSSTPSVSQTRAKEGGKGDQQRTTSSQPTRTTEGNVMSRANNNDNNTIIMNKTK